MDADVPPLAHQRVLPALMAAVGLLVVGLAVLVGIASVGLGASWLDSAWDESALPPASHLPDVPSDARVIGQEEACGSGGCWWELRLEPADGQSPADLAAAMGVTENQQLPGTLVDPRTVFLASEVRDDELRIYLGYEQLLP